MKINKWIDGQKYNSDYIDSCLLPYFESNNNKIKKLKNVGIVIHNNILNVFLPKNTNEKFVSIKEIKLLLNSLIKYRYYSLLSNINQMFRGNELFYIIDWIIKDFCNNGLILQRKKNSKKRYNGKINWDKSIKKISPFIINNEPILTEFYKDKFSYIENYLSVIQSIVLEDISKKYYKIFNFEYFNVNNEFSLNSENKDKIIFNLKEVLLSTNNTRKIKLTKYLIAYINNFGNNKGPSIVTDKFNIIFEECMRQLLGSNKKLQQYISLAHWKFKIDGHILTSLNHQIPDALKIKNDDLYIYDAKYYNFTVATLNENNSFLPLDWNSVSKQLLYDLSFNYSNFSSKIYNYFVFPYYPLKHKYKYVGNVHINLNTGLKQIGILRINTFKALKVLLNNN